MLRRAFDEMNQMLVSSYTKRGGEVILRLWEFRVCCHSFSNEFGMWCAMKLFKRVCLHEANHTLVTSIPKFRFPKQVVDNRSAKQFL